MTSQILDWSRFTILSNRNRTLAVAGLCVTIFFDEPVLSIAPRLADAIEMYVSVVGLGRLDLYLTESGYWRPMTAAKLRRDIRLLRAFPPEENFLGIEYQSDFESCSMAFGIEADASDLVGRAGRTRANYLRFDFPPSWPEQMGVDTLLTFVSNLLAGLRPTSAQVGVAFKRMAGRSDEASQGVHCLLPRYLGFDPGYSPVFENMRGRILTAHWLNYLDDGLVTALGGYGALRAALAECEVYNLGGGVLVRGAKLPPIGDINRGGLDLGQLPAVARLLKPIRASIHAFGRPDFDGNAWLARLDELPSRPWDNSDAR